MAATIVWVLVAVAVLVLIGILVFPLIEAEINPTFQIPDNGYVLRNEYAGQYLAVDSAGASPVYFDSSTSSNLIVFTPSGQSLTVWGLTSGDTGLNGQILTWQAPGAQNILVDTAANVGSRATTQWSFTIGGNTQIRALDGPPTGFNFLGSTQTRPYAPQMDAASSVHPEATQWTFVKATTI